MKVRARLEAAFEVWARWAQRGGLLWVLLAFAVTGAMGSQMADLKVDTSTESYLLRTDSARSAYDRLRTEFGRDEVAVIAAEPGDVFEIEFLEHLRDLHNALEEGVPHLDRITSLINVRKVEGRGDELVVGDLLETLPTNAAEMEALRRRVFETPSYLDGVISRDGGMALIVLEASAYSSLGTDTELLGGFDAVAQDAPDAFLTAEENDAFVEAVKTIAARFERPGVPLYVAGSTMISHEITQAMLGDAPIFFGGALIAVSIALVALFRRLVPCLIALLVVTCSVIATLGSASALGHPLSMLSQVIPSFLLAVGVGYAVHLLALYFQRLDAGLPGDAALVAALRHSGPPVLMTALTTMAGLASFLVAEMPPMQHFGVAALLGVGWALIFNLTLLPALVSLLPGRGRTRKGRSGTPLVTRLGLLSARNPWRVVGAAASLAVLAALSSTNIVVSNDPISYLAPGSPFRVAHTLLDERLGASMTLELLLDSGKDGGLYEPEVMDKIAALDAYFADFELDGHGFRRTTSIVDIVKETHQALGGNDPSFYAIPRERELLAQELLLFENTGADDVQRVVDPQFRLTRYSAGSRFRDGNQLAPVIDKVRSELPEVLGENIDVSVTGTMALISGTMIATGRSLLRTYALAVFVITPLMILLIGSLRLGLVSMVPNLLPIAVTLGIMPIVGWPLDVFTMMVGCIAIGLAVDDTLHFIHGFRARLALSGDPARAIEETLQTTGRALLYTSVVLCVGFLVLTLSSMSNLRAMGALTAIAIGSAFLLDILVTPALLMLATRPRSKDSALSGPSA